MPQFQSFAPPMMWGPWQTIASHVGSAKYKVIAEPIGETLLECRIRYFKGDAGGIRVEEQFLRETEITTANAVANVEVSFRGVVLGTAVRGTITP